MLCKFDIAAQGIIDTKGLTDFCGGGADALDLAAEDEIFDPSFDFIIQLIPVVAEKFDAVVFVGIVGCG